MSKILNYGELNTVIRETAPILMIDRLSINEDGTSASGVKCISMNEDFFQGHFPGSPIMPGVLQVAAMTQLSEAILAEKKDTEGKVPVLTAIKKLKFRKPVFPGDVMIIESEADADTPNVFKTKTLVNGNVTCQGILTVELKEQSELTAVCDELTPEDPSFEGIELEQVKDVMDISGIIPHRYPFLLVDRILYSGEDRVIGQKNVTGNESFFKGLPFAMLPGFLQAEISAQVACVWGLGKPEAANKLAYFMSIDNASFNRPILPGDKILVDVTISGRGRFGKAEAKIYVGSEIVTEASFKFAIVDQEG